VPLFFRRALHRPLACEMFAPWWFISLAKGLPQHSHRYGSLHIFGGSDRVIQVVQQETHSQVLSKFYALLSHRDEILMTISIALCGHRLPFFLKVL